MADLAPISHSYIGTNSTNPEGRIQGIEGEDSNGNPIPAWSDNPLFTRNGLSGPAYSGSPDRPRGLHIIELQQDRTKREVDLGIPLTDFSDIATDDHISRRHIVELRESTEKILNALGLTLEDYFKLDPEGNEVAQASILETFGASNPQTEWVDVDRSAAYIDKNGASKTTFLLPDGSTADSPTLPSREKIRAIHIEDLRHPIQVVKTSILYDGIERLFTASKDGDATFSNTQLCGTSFSGSAFDAWFHDRDDGTIIQIFADNSSLENNLKYVQNTTPNECDPF